MCHFLCTWVYIALHCSVLSWEIFFKLPWCSAAAQRLLLSCWGPHPPIAPPSRDSPPAALPRTLCPTLLPWKQSTWPSHVHSVKIVKSTFSEVCVYDFLFHVGALRIEYYTKEWVTSKGNVKQFCNESPQGPCDLFSLFIQVECWKLHRNSWNREKPQFCALPHWCSFSDHWPTIPFSTVLFQLIICSEA